jgi:hypothetical protein
MDIRLYFHKIQQAEASIETPYVVVISLETPDGGRPGVKTEVSRSIAAQLIVEGKVRLANEAETGEYHAEITAAHERAEKLARARMRWAYMTEAELRTRLQEKE